MKLGRITGTVVCTKKVPSFEGIRLLLVQPVDEHRVPCGDPLVAFDTVHAGPGELVYFETSKEAGRVLETTMNPCDAAVMAIVDEITLEEKA